MNKPPKAGLLPCYLALYDKTDPPRRGRFDPLLREIETRLQAAGIAVEAAPICCVEAEFRSAVDRLEGAGVDALVLVHLAYSPSLESAGVLVASRLPVVFLDTTMDYAFGTDVEPSRISYNHGIHGVQDLASVLRRKGKAYEVVAGHVTESDVVARAAERVRAYAAAHAFRAMRVLRLGETFPGMGDFAVPDALLAERFGIQVETRTPADLAPYVGAISNDEVARERADDTAHFDVTAPAEVHDRSARVGMGLRCLLAEKSYGAFSMSFPAFDTPDPPVNVVPFVEASKAMARGLGYAGEGDVLTAALVGAWSFAFGRTTFTEAFCPDWEGDALFMSHMGEVNPHVAAAKPRLIELDFPYTNALNPTALACDYASGAATLLNIAPGPNESFGLVASRVHVFGEAEHPGLRDSVRGWLKPEIPLEAFLEAYSAQGGTHHSALVYGDHCDGVRVFGAALGMPVSVL